MDESLKVMALEVVKKHGKAMALEMLDVVVVPALEQAAKASATPIDDAVLAALKEPLKAALKQLIEGM